MTTTRSADGALRHAAGSPATQGGRYAPEATPAAAAELTVPRTTAGIRADVLDLVRSASADIREQYPTALTLRLEEGTPVIGSEGEVLDAEGQSLGRFDLDTSMDAWVSIDYLLKEVGRRDEIDLIFDERPERTPFGTAQFDLDLTHDWERDFVSQRKAETREVLRQLRAIDPAAYLETISAIEKPRLIENARHLIGDIDSIDGANHEYTRGIAELLTDSFTSDKPDQDHDDDKHDMVLAISGHDGLARAVVGR